jgi:diguanylate cyclase (GGDEF)-like protein
VRQSAAPGDKARERWEALAESFGQDIYAEALYSLTRLELPPDEARECMLSIVDRQREMSAALGRPVSLVTAASDYFSQVRPMLREPVLVDVRLLQQKEEGAYRDELTGLFNRRFFNHELPREIERFRRFGQPFSLLMLDLDHFKDFNDAHGHSAGDQALRDTASTLLDTARLYDRAVRYGGEEFAIILPQTSAEEAWAVAERIRDAQERRHVIFAGQNLGPVSISIGLASFPKDALDMEGLVQSADQALYQAKETRNCVRQYRDPKRVHRRYALSDPMPLRLVAPGSAHLPANAQDISLSGLCCSSESPLPAFTDIHVVLSDAARSITLPVKAQVRRVSRAEDNSYKLGLSFELNDPEEQMKLLTLLDGRLNRAPFQAAPRDERRWS